MITVDVLQTTNNHRKLGIANYTNNRYRMRLNCIIIITFIVSFDTSRISSLSFSSKKTCWYLFVVLKWGIFTKKTAPQTPCWIQHQASASSFCQHSCPSQRTLLTLTTLRLALVVLAAPFQPRQP